MRYCRNCGAPLDDDALFCRECGNKVETALPVIPQPQVTTTVTQAENETFVDVERDNRLYYIIGGVVAAVLLAAGGWWFYNRNSGNNPLGVEKPKWEKFAMVNADGVKLYKEANASSPHLQLAVERLETCMPDEKMLWYGDRVSGRYDVSDYVVEMKTVFPVLDESDSWYKIHVGMGEIREAYLQKQYCEEVKPKPITKEIIDRICAGETDTYRLVEKGEFANLFIQHEAAGFNTIENMTLGVLTEGCIVMPTRCICFPQMTDTTGVAIRNVSGTLEYESWNLICPENYWKKTSDEENPLVFDVNNLTESDLSTIVMSLKTTGRTDTKVLYYFPDAGEDRFVSLEYSFSPVKTAEVEEDKTVTRYEVNGSTLKAEVGGNIITALTFDDALTLITQLDIDDDGSMECVLVENSGGNIGDNPFVVTYDADNDKFIKSEYLEHWGTPAIEEKDGKPTMVQRFGLRWVRYVMENHTLRKAEDEVKSWGTVRATLETDNVYAENEEGDMNVKFDFDGDGNDDNLTLHRGMTHAEGYGVTMALNSVVLSDGISHDIGLMAEKYSFLESKTNGMPDIIADNYLYRWSGSQYEAYEWDGKNIVKQYLGN